MQLYTAVPGRQNADVLREYAGLLAESPARDHRDLVVPKMTESLRPARVLPDWSHDTAAKTTTLPCLTARSRASHGDMVEPCSGEVPGCPRPAPGCRREDVSLSVDSTPGSPTCPGGGRLSG